MNQGKVYLRKTIKSVMFPQYFATYATQQLLPGMPAMSLPSVPGLPVLPSIPLPALALNVANQREAAATTEEDPDANDKRNQIEV